MQPSLHCPPKRFMSEFRRNRPGHNSGRKQARNHHHQKTDDFIQQRSLWIGDIEPWMDENHIRSYFSQLPTTIRSIKLIKDKDKGTPVGYGFIEFKDGNEAAEVFDCLNGKQIPGYPERYFKLNRAVHGGGAARVAPVSSGHQRHQNLQTDGYQVYVGELNQSVTNQELLDFFKRSFHSAYEAKIIFDHQTRASKGYGFIKFSLKEQADRSLNEMQGKLFQGKAIRMKPASQQKKTGLPTDLHGCNQNSRDEPYNMTPSPTSSFPRGPHAGGPPGFIQHPPYGSDYTDPRHSPRDNRMPPPNMGHFQQQQQQPWNQGAMDHGRAPSPQGHGMPPFMQQPWMQGMGAPPHGMGGPPGMNFGPRSGAPPMGGHNQGPMGSQAMGGYPGFYQPPQGNYPMQGYHPGAWGQPPVGPAGNWNQYNASSQEPKGRPCSIEDYDPLDDYGDTMENFLTTPVKISSDPSMGRRFTITPVGQEQVAGMNQEYASDPASNVEIEQAAQVQPQILSAIPPEEEKPSFSLELEGSCKLEEKEIQNAKAEAKAESTKEASPSSQKSCESQGKLALKSQKSSQKSNLSQGTLSAKSGKSSAKSAKSAKSGKSGKSSGKSSAQPQGKSSAKSAKAQRQTNAASQSSLGSKQARSLPHSQSSEERERSKKSPKASPQSEGGSSFNSGAEESFKSGSKSAQSAKSDFEDDAEIPNTSYSTTKMPEDSEQRDRLTGSRRPFNQAISPSFSPLMQMQYGSRGSEGELPKDKVIAYKRQRLS